jgi:hypothetical protein
MSVTVSISNSKSHLRSCWATAQRMNVRTKFSDFSFFDYSDRLTKKYALLGVKRTLFFFKTNKFKSINYRHFTFFSQKKIATRSNVCFLRIKTSIFRYLSDWLCLYKASESLPVSQLQSRSRNLAKSLVVHKLILNRILLVRYTSDQKLFRATFSSLMTEVIVLLVEKWPTTEDHSNYSVRYSSVKALFIVKLRKIILTMLLKSS